MGYKLYVCNYCKQSFYYNKDQGESGLCRNCLHQSLHERKDRIIFICKECHRHYDASILLDNPRLGKKKFKFQLGRILCPKDDNPLELQSLKDDVYQLTRDLLNQFSDVQKPEITEESDFLAKVNRLKEDVMSDIQTKTDVIAHKTMSSLAPDTIVTKQHVESTTSETAGDKNECVESISVKPYIEEKYISPIDFVGQIPCPPPFTPYADEFWQFYYKEKKFKELKIFPGKTRAPQKIRHFLDEVGRFFLNPAQIDLRLPFYERLGEGKIIYVGDTHGSVFDTDKIIEHCMKEIELAESKKYDLRIVFVGDYVDRNTADIHNVLYIFAFALQYPQYVRLLRGNHEEVTINMQYGFWENINDQLPNSYLFNDFEYTFMNLPLIHVIGFEDKKIMCLHGGIPFYDQGFEEMPEIPRIMEGLDQLDCRHATIDEMDVLSQQILWSDPVDQLPPRKFFLPNPRGIGFTFSKAVFDAWCAQNGIDRIVRGHEVFVEGHREYFENRLFSLFSNSEYTGRKIKAKILEMDLTKNWEDNWSYFTIQDDL